MDEDDKRKIRNILPNLTKEVSPTEILPYLTCLSDMARQEIMNTERYNSSHASMLTLHTYIIRQGRGFTELVSALTQVDKHELVHKLTNHTGSEAKPDKSKQLMRRPPSKQSPKRDTHSAMAVQKTENGHHTCIKDLNVCVFQILDQLDYSGRQNWESLAGYLDFKVRDCQKIEHDANSYPGRGKTRNLLDQRNELTLGELLHILKYKMERVDIVEQLEEFTGYKLPEDKIDNDSAGTPKQGITSNTEMESHNLRNSTENARRMDITKAEFSDIEIPPSTNKNNGVDMKVSNSPGAKYVASYVQSTFGFDMNINDKQNTCRPKDNHHSTGFTIDRSESFQKNQVDRACFDKDNIDEIETDGLCATHGNGHIFTYSGNDESISVERDRLHAREEGSLRNDGDESRIVIGQVTHQPRHVNEVQYSRQDNNPSGPYSPVLKGSTVPITEKHRDPESVMAETIEPSSGRGRSPAQQILLPCLHVSGNTSSQLHDEQETELGDHTSNVVQITDISMISVGDPKSVHHHSHEGAMQSSDQNRGFIQQTGPQLLNDHITESRDATDDASNTSQGTEVSLISIGDPQSVHQHKESQIKSTEGFDICSDVGLVDDSFRKDLESLLASNEGNTEEQGKTNEEFSDHNENIQGEVHVVCNDNGNSTSLGITDNKGSSEHQLCEGPTGGFQLPNWDMLHSGHNSSLHSNFNSTTSANEFNFLQEIDVQRSETVSTDTYSVSDSSQPGASDGQYDLHTDPSSSTSCAPSEPDQIENKDQIPVRYILQDNQLAIVNAISDENVTENNNNENNNRESMKDNHASQSESFTRNSSTEYNTQQCAEGQMLELENQEPNKDGGVLELEHQSFPWIKGTLLAAGGAVMASLVYKSLKG